MFESFGRLIIVLLDEGVTITLYICVLYIYIYIYIIQQFSLKYVAFESTLLNFTQNPYEIGPSNAS